MVVERRQSEREREREPRLLLRARLRPPGEVYSERGEGVKNRVRNCAGRFGESGAFY